MPDCHGSIDGILGQEFLTWLWFQSDTAPGAFRDMDGQPFGVSLEQRVVVEGGDGESHETATVSGNLSPLLEARFGLLRGKKVTRATIRMEKDELFFQLTLRAEDFSLGALKTPKIENSDDEPDSMLLEKFYLMEQCIKLLDSLYRTFIALRISAKWDFEVTQIQTWLAKSG